MAVMANSYQQYVRHDVMMATPMELVVMLYTGCVKRLRLGQMAIDKKDYEAANGHLQRAQDIVMELMMGLDLQYDIGRDLLKIYEFVHRQIVEANMAKNAGLLGPVADIMGSLRETWIQVQRENKTSSHFDYEYESEYEMKTQEKTELMRILGLKKDMLTRMLGLTQQIRDELLYDRIEAFDEAIKARQALIGQIDALTRAEHNISADDDIGVIAAKRAVRDIVAKTLKLDEENTALAQQKLESYRSQIRQMNQTKKGVGTYARPMNQENAYFVDANK
jgi:flagellar protein FliS